MLGSTRTLGGERLMEMQETCTTTCAAYLEEEGWIYFAGPLKAVTPNRLASEARHFFYGERQGTASTDTKIQAHKLIPNRRGAINENLPAVVRRGDGGRGCGY